MNDNSPYADAWAKIDSLEQNGLPRSALEATEALYQQAKADEEPAEWVKTIIYLNKFQSQIEEEGLAEAIRRVQSEADSASFPVKPVLHTLLAGLYQRYLEENRWQISQRTTVAGERPAEINLWTIRDLLDETAKQYLLSVHDKNLINIPIEEWAPITTPISAATTAA